MGKKYKVTVRGTGQLNGSVIINKSVIYDDHIMAYKFTGGDRYEVLAGFVRTHYPGVKFNPKDFVARVEVIDDKNSKNGGEKSKISGEGLLNKFIEYMRSKYPRFSAGFVFIANIFLWLLAILFSTIILSTPLGLSFVIGFTAFLILWKYIGVRALSTTEYFIVHSWDILEKKIKWSNIIGLVSTAVTFIIYSYIAQ
jgi:hypothetical protein